MLAQERRHLRLDRVRVDAAGVDGGLLVVLADGVAEAAAALERRRVGGVVVHAHEALHALALGALARALARFVLGLAHVHDGAQLLALLHRAAVDGDERDLLGRDLADRALQHLVVGDGGDHAVHVLRRRLLDEARHVGQVAARRVAVLDLHAVVLARLLDGVLDRVPPRIGIGRVADQHVPVGVRRAGRHQGRERGRLHQQLQPRGVHGLVSRGVVVSPTRGAAPRVETAKF